MLLSPGPIRTVCLQTSCHGMNKQTIRDLDHGCGLLTPATEHSQLIHQQDNKMGFPRDSYSRSGDIYKQ